MSTVSEPDAVERTGLADLNKRNILMLSSATSICLALVAIFVLSKWAEASTLGHGLQHVLIFVAGLGFGTSMLELGRQKGSKK